MTSPLRTAPPPQTPPSRLPRSNAWRPITSWRWLDALLIALGALLVRIPSMFAPTQLGYDDGGYGLAAIAMRQGFEPFRQIFSPQGPLFLPLVHVADLVGLEHRNAPRLLSVAAGIVCTLSVYAIAIQIMDRGRAVLAGALTAGSGVLLWTTGPLTGDGPAAAFATAAVAVAIAYRRYPTRTRAVLITALAGCAVATKSLLVGPALLIAWVLVAQRRRVIDTLMVPIGAFAIVVALSLPWGVHHVLNDYVWYHLDKTSNRKPLYNLNRLVRTFWQRDTFLTSLAAIGAVSTATSWGRGSRRRTLASAGEVTDSRMTARPGADTRFLWWWAGIVIVVLTLQDPMFRNHLCAFVAPAALLVALHRPSWRWVAIVGVVAIPLQASTLEPLLRPRGYRGTNAEIVAALRRLPHESWALSDEPGLVWRAGLGTDPFFVDASVLRSESTVRSIRITETRIVRGAEDRRVCAVVITALDRFGRYPGLPGRLVRAGYRRTINTGTQQPGDGRGLYRRDRCRS